VKRIPVARLKGTDTSPAGIPLDHNGIRFEDQSRDDLFHHYDSVEIKFCNEEGVCPFWLFCLMIMTLIMKDCKTFENDFKKYLIEWRTRCQDLEDLKRRIQNSHVITNGRVQMDETRLPQALGRFRY